MKNEDGKVGYKGLILVPITFQTEDVQEDLSVKLRAEMLSDINGQIVDVKDIKNLICLDCGLRLSTNNLLKLIKKQYGSPEN